jgi:hypothetical protein
MPAKIAIDAIPYVRCDLRDVNRRVGVNADMNAMLSTIISDGGDPFIREGFDGVGCHLDFQIEKPHTVANSRVDAILDFVPLPEIQTDPVTQTHHPEVPPVDIRRLHSGRGLSNAALSDGVIL